MHSVIETPDYLSDAKAAGMTDEERSVIVNTLARDPLSGVAIPGTGGARKIRFGGRGKGKSGGYRVITFHSGDDIPVFLLNVFAKSERVDLSQADRNELKKELAGLATEYTQGVRSHVDRR